MTIEAKVLGPLSLANGCNLVSISGEGQRTCLALLLLARGKAVSSDALREELWGEQPPASASASLQMQMSRLRRCFAEAGLDGGVLVAERGGYALRLDGCKLDVDAFEALVAEGRADPEQENPHDRATRLRQALALWRGSALEDAGDGPRITAERARLGAQRTAAMIAWAEAELALGRHRPLVGELERLAAENPFEERIRGLLMLALYRSGRQAEALAAYRACRTKLVDELGIEPSHELRELNNAMLRQDPALLLTQPAPVRPIHDPRDKDLLAPRARRSVSRAAAVVGAAVAALCIGGLAVAGAIGGSTGLSNVSPGEVAVIGPNGTIDSAFKGVSQPVALTSDGRFVWLADASSSTVTRLDPHAPRTLLSVTVTSPSALAAVKGNVWVLSTAHRQLQEVNEDAGEAVRTIRVGNGAIALAAADGSVWVADITDGTVTRVDAMSGRVRGRIVVGGQPDAVTAGTGAVWVADRESGTVDRIDPESDRITASIPTGGHPSAIAVAGGQVWVADPLDGTLSRIDPASDAINATLPIGVGGNALATDGRWLWVDGPHPGELTRIDAVHARATSTIHTGSPTVALASARHRIFAATTRPTAARRGGTLTIVGTRGPMPAWAPDPGATFDQDSWQLQAMTNDGLLAARKVGGAAGAELVPDLASSMPVASDGGRTWTFQLRRGLRYSTGQPVRASDVRASFERLEQIAGPAVKDLPTLGLVGEAACRSRPRSCDLSRGVLADDRSGTVVLRLVRPESDLLQRLATPPYFVLPAGTQPRPITAPPFPATGPYEVVTRRAGEIQLARNPYFHAWSAEAQPPGFPDRIVWRLRASAASGVNSILSGRGDVLDAPATTKDAELLATRYPTLLHLNPFPDTEALFLNTRRRPFSSLAARQAVALATNRRVLAADQGTPLVWPVTCQVLPPGIPGYRPFCPYTANAGAAGGWSGPDLARARELARRAHLSGTTITVAGPSDRPAVLRAVTDFAHGLRAIGLRPRIISRPVKGVDGYFSFIAHHRARIQAGWFHWFIDRPDPAEFLDPLASCPGHGRQQQINANAPRYCDRTTDAAITHAEAAMNDNPTAAAATWAAVDARVTRSAAWIPYANGRSLAFTSRRASGYAYNPIYSTLLDQISIK